MALQQQLTAQNKMPHSQKKIEHLVQDIKNGPNHVCGDHSNCADYFCSGNKAGEENVFPAIVQCGIYEEIRIARVAANAASLIMDVDNNHAEHSVVVENG